MYFSVLSRSFRQHRSLFRDVEIVMVNGLTPWGNTHFVPRGPMREPLSALTRADIVVIHHADLVCFTPCDSDFHILCVSSRKFIL
jgi:tetraacyldisaccharide-1-P 4'-kinase